MNERVKGNENGNEEKRKSKSKILGYIRKSEGYRANRVDSQVVRRPPPGLADYIIRRDTGLRVRHSARRSSPKVRGGEQPS